MKKAAEIMAMSAVELVLNKPLLNKVKAEFTERMKGKKYRLPPRCGKRPGQ